MTVRAEREIFDELATLCASQGYSHAIAYLCFRDHIVGYGDVLRAEDYSKLFSFDRLIRTEISTLIGLMARAPRDLTIPDSKILENYIERTEILLRELHECLIEPANAELRKAFSDPGKSKDFNPFANADALREPIFYGAESAYSFQYRDLSVKKYARDQEWLRIHKGFIPEEARDVVAAINEFVGKNLLTTLKAMRKLPPERWSILAGFQFTVIDIVSDSGLSESVVRSVIDAFTYSEDGNGSFTSLNEFNSTNAFPILRGCGDSRILFLYANLTESLYESPFYWMSDDKFYRTAAMANRGAFTEEFTEARLQQVFGADKFFRNINIWETSARKNKLGEIDVLVLFGDRAIVVQAKSKKLTLAARKGNDLQLKVDFKAAVQDACDQAILCIRHLRNGISFLARGSGEEIKLPSDLKKIHPVCVVSDHYPALSFQSQQFLSFQPNAHIEQPLICDVFFIDVVTEFLETPLHFLSYLELRARAANDVGLSHETVALGFHLHQNLWLGENDFIMLSDDISVDIDIAMAARRDGVDGEKSPPGILTRLKNTAVGRIIQEIEQSSEPGAIGAGLELLKLSGKSSSDLSRIINQLAADALDGKPRDATLAGGRAGSGFTVHCNALPEAIAGPSLRRHCELRKYSTNAGTWFGLAIRPGDGAVRFGLMLEYPWKRDVAMDAIAAKMPVPQPTEAIRRILKGSRGRKIGRNELCPCGSSLKYKNAIFQNEVSITNPARLFIAVYCDIIILCAVLRALCFRSYSLNLFRSSSGLPRKPANVARPNDVATNLLRPSHQWHTLIRPSGPPSPIREKEGASRFSRVMVGLVPTIHVFAGLRLCSRRGCSGRAQG